MESAHSTNYHRIAQAIAYIEQHFQSQPSLEEIAAHVHLSPFHFQRLFSEWAGVSPKQFIQYLTLQYAQQLLQKKEINLFNVALESGLSGTGRLHDLFVTLVGMTPGEYKNGAAELSIFYAYYDSPFGSVLLASTSKGLCHMAFCEDEKEALQELIERFPNATFKQEATEFHQQALAFFEEKHPEKKIRLHLKGSPFQLKVWEALLKIPMGEVSSYGNIAQMIQQPVQQEPLELPLARIRLPFLFLVTA
ncbi:MAG: hypothetical protein RLZZ543_2324 [Bacteroidota bacterium]|jgi:AraC family transcriptional regulator of adaptative response/methylated-DNA-[protein]-cysteine methyltransferase